MSENIIEKIIQSLLPLKIPTERFLAILLLISMFALFVPMDLLQKLALLDFVDSNRTTISVIFIFSMAYFFVELVCKLFNKIKEYNCYKKQTKLLTNLPKAEKDIVIKMYKNDHSCNLSPSSPKVCSLCHKNVIYRSTMLGTADSFGYTLQPWVAEYIDKHKNYVR